MHKHDLEDGCIVGYANECILHNKHELPGWITDYASECIHHHTTTGVHGPHPSGYMHEWSLQTDTLAIYVKAIKPCTLELHGGVLSTSTLNRDVRPGTSLPPPKPVAGGYWGAQNRFDSMNPFLLTDSIRCCFLHKPIRLDFPAKSRRLMPINRLTCTTGTLKALGSRPKELDGE